MSKKRKVSDNEIVFVKKLCSKGVRYTRVIEEFKSKFGREISKGIVSSIALEKLKPICETPTEDTSQSKDTSSSQQFSKEQIDFMIKARLRNCTSEDASKQFKEKFDKNVRRDIISSFWKGKMEVEEDIANSDDYKAMVGYKRKRVVKFTDEERAFIKSLEEPSNTKCVGIFKAKFGKDITKQYIARIKTGT
jgi:hypothetical protein